MKKFLLSLATLALAGASAMAAPAEIFTVTFGSAGNVSAPNIGAYDKSQTYTGKAETVVADKTWTVTNFNNNNNNWSEFIKCGRKTDSTGSVATDFAFAEKITSVDIALVINYANVTSIDRPLHIRRWHKLERNGCGLRNKHHYGYKISDAD